MIRVFALQRRVVRVLGGLGYREDARQKFVELRLMTLPSKYIYLSVLYVRHNLREFNLVSDVHDHGTRNNNNIRLPFLRLSHSRNAKNYYGPLFYNHLPKTLKQLNDKQFLASLKKILITKCFYTFEAFLNTTLNDHHFL